jgi:hypothetical protein
MGFYARTIYSRNNFIVLIFFCLGNLVDGASPFNLIMAELMRSGELEAWSEPRECVAMYMATSRKKHAKNSYHFGMK